jgi:hypothetical protein
MHSLKGAKAPRVVVPPCSEETGIPDLPYFPVEDQELPGDWEAVEKAIEDWINSVPADKWPQYPTKIAWNGQYSKSEKT